MFKLTTLLVSLTPLVGVNVAVHVMLLLVVKVLNVPLATVTSELPNPLTASVKLIVTVDVSPAFKLLLLKVIVALGANVSTS